jgi:hypothetical protein
MGVPEMTNLIREEIKFNQINQHAVGGRQVDHPIVLIVGVDQDAMPIGIASFFAPFCHSISLWSRQLVLPGRTQSSAQHFRPAELAFIANQQAEKMKLFKYSTNSHFSFLSQKSFQKNVRNFLFFRNVRQNVFLLFFAFEMLAKMYFFFCIFTLMFIIMCFFGNLNIPNFPSKLPIIFISASTAKLMLLEIDHQAVVVHMIIARLSHALVHLVVVGDVGDGAILKRE